MTVELKKKINALINKHKFVMFEFIGGKVYHLVDHHKYLDPEDAPKKLLGNCNDSTYPKGIRFSNRNRNSRILYITTPLK